MTSWWDLGIAQAMQRHGGSHHSTPKVKAPATVPDATPLREQPMVEQGAPLVPETPRQDETWD
jgi:hypothetical protein